MPLLGKKIFVCVKPLANRKSEEILFSIPHTKEQFRNKQDYEKRIALYEKSIWTCQSTGHTNLTHEEAWKSEKMVRKSVKSQYQACYEKPVLEHVHHSTYSLDNLVDQTWLKLQQVLSIDEKVSLKIRTTGKVVKAKVVRVDTCGIEANPTSNCSSPSSDKENTHENSVNKDTGQKKWIPPKLLPYKYSIKLDDEDKIINCVPAADLSRVDRPPAKELLRLFIRTHALRAGQTFSSPWVVDESMIKKHGIQNRIADVFLSPMKIQDPVIIHEGSAAKKRKSLSKSDSSDAKKAKTDKEKKKKKDKDDESGKKKKKQSKLDAVNTKKKTPTKKSLNHKAKSSATDDSSDSDSDSDADSDSSEECSLVALKNQMKDDDLPLSALKIQLTPVKAKKSDSRQNTPKKDKGTPKKDKGTPKKGTPKKNKSPQKDGAKSKKKSSKDDDEKKKKKKEKKLKEKEKKKEKNKDKKKEKLKDKIKEKSKDKDKETPKKGKSMKQMTLLEMSAKKTPRTPDKKKPVNPNSPQKPPLIVRKLITAMKNKDTNKAEYKKILQKVIVHLSPQQREKLPAEVKDVVQKAYELHEEKKKLNSMSPEEREAYLKKKKEEAKTKAREERKAKQAELRRRFEDNDLDHKTLPQPKVVPNPDGLPGDAFGDATMVTEFINCFAGLLMPQDEQVFYTELLMTALVEGNDGFPYISQILVILLQTLLQDEISEDYSELNTSLSDIPVNPYTASELVRLALRKNDIDGPDENQSDASSDDGIEELEVNEEVIGMLENHELHELDAMQKLQILKGLCLRIMGTYSVQDFMEQKQAEASGLWRKKLSSFKERKQNKELSMKLLQSKIEDLNDTKENDPQNENVKENRNIKNSGLTITDFYGNKVVEDEVEAALSDDGLASVVKRRRQRSAVAAQEKEKRDKEEKERREKENVLLRKLKEEQAFEKAFADGIQFAKNVLRLTPIGTDRNHDRYWIFSKCTPGLYIERGWVHDSITHSMKTETPMEQSSESSDDDADPDSAINQKSIETTVPNPGQNIWFVYDTVEELTKLTDSLHTQGVRESALKNEIKKRWEDLVRHFSNKKATPKEDDTEKDVMAAFKHELKETEMRLRNGGLGGIIGVEEWEQKLDNAKTLAEVGDCLLDTKNCVLERFLQGIMGKKTKPKSSDSDKKDDAEKEDENAVKEEDNKEELVCVGYLKWKEAIENCHTISRMHVLLGIMDACIKWEKSAENSKCKICRKKGVGEQLILCDECNQAFHLYCLRPALHDIPEGDWYCPACVPERRNRRAASRKSYNEETEEESSSDYDSSDESQCRTENPNCVVCGCEDELIECSECTDLYHIDCHQPALRHAPRGNWVCTDCKDGYKRKKKRPFGWRKPVTEKKKRGGKRKTPSRRKKPAKVSESEEEEEESEEEVEDNSDDEVEYIPKKTTRRSRRAKTTKSKTDSEEGSQEEEEEDEEEENEIEEVPDSDEEYVSAVAAQCQEECKASAASTQTSFTDGGGSSKQTGTQTATAEFYPSERQQQNMELSICEAILIRLIMNKESWPFRLPVDEKEVPDYYEIIANPIDFRTIKHKTVDREYKYSEHFIEDISLMFRNCACYNAVDSEVYRCMLVLEKQFTHLLSKFLPHLHYSRRSNGYNDQTYTCYGTKKRGHCM